MATYTAGALLAGFALAFFRVTESRGLDARGYTWSAPLSLLAVFSMAWHEPWATGVVFGLGVVVSVVWLGVRAREGRLSTGRELVQTAALVLLLLTMGLASRYALFDVTDPVTGAVEARPLSFFWFPWIGGLVAFFFGWLLSDPADPLNDPETP